jgi:hypothetical protein
MSDINASVNDIKADIAAVPTGSADPANLRAAEWGIGLLGTPASSSYGYGGTVKSPGMTAIGAPFPKCNIFVANAYAIGAGLGFGSGGVPTSITHPLYGLGFITHTYPPGATNWGGSKPLGDFSFLGSYATPSAVSGQQVGDIVAFNGGTGNHHHVTLSLGGNLLIYAGAASVKTQTLMYDWAHEGESTITIHRYAP